jgi:hypothetical protein
MFNEDQKGYMKYLAEIPPEEKCWCGWYLCGECSVCPPDKTNADKRKVWCPECHSDPGPNGEYPLTHTRGCSRNKR